MGQSVTQRMGSVFAKALNLDLLPVPNKVKQLIFAAAERAIPFQFVLTATAKNDNCGGKSSGSSDANNVEDADTINQNLMLIEHPKTGTITEFPTGMKRKKKCHCGCSENSTIAMDPGLTDGSNPPVIISEDGQMEPDEAFIGNIKRCCGLGNVSILPDAVKDGPQDIEVPYNVEIKLPVKKKTITIARLTLFFKVSIKYQVNKNLIGEVSGDCPEDCSDETRNISVGVLISGEYKAEIEILDFKNFFGGKKGKVNLSNIPNLKVKGKNNSTISTNDIKGQKNAGGTIMVGAKFGNYADVFVYEFSCTPGKRANLKLISKPGFPELAGDENNGASGGETPGADSNRNDCIVDLFFRNITFTNLPANVERVGLLFRRTGQRRPLLAVQGRVQNGVFVPMPPINNQRLIQRFVLRNRCNNSIELTGVTVDVVALRDPAIIIGSQDANILFTAPLCSTQRRTSNANRNIVFDEGFTVSLDLPVVYQCGDGITGTDGFLPTLPKGLKSECFFRAKLISVVGNNLKLTGKDWVFDVRLGDDANRIVGSFEDNNNSALKLKKKSRFFTFTRRTCGSSKDFDIKILGTAIEAPGQPNALLEDAASIACSGSGNIKPVVVTFRINKKQNGGKADPDQPFSTIVFTFKVAAVCRRTIGDSIFDQ